MRTLTILVTGLFVLLPSTARAQRLDAGGFLTYAFLERIGSNDHQAGTSTLGLGGRAAWHLARFVDLDADLAVHPNAGVSGAKLEGFFGAKAGLRSRWVGGFVKARPGFLYFSKDPFGVGTRGAMLGRTEWAHSLDPALDVGAVIEFYTPGRVIVRVDLGDTMVRYHPRTVGVSQMQPPLQAGGFTTRNRHWSVGLSQRF